MMENVAMEQEHDSEYVFYDVLDKIFHYLDFMSLCNVAVVSRSWNHFAKKEILKRSTGQLYRMILPVLYNTDKPEFEATDYFGRDKPNTLLMFCGPQAIQRPALNVEYKIMEQYYERIPGRMIILGVEQAMMDTNEVFSCKNESIRNIESKKFNQILALGLAECEDVKIEIVECVSHEEKTAEKGAYIFDGLHAAAEGVEHPIFLLFSRSGYSIGSHVMRLFNERYAGKPVSLWGSTIADYIKRSDDGYPSYQGTHGFLGILLHGPKLRAHCLVLPINEDESCMYKKIAEFAGTLNLGRRSVGLVCGPKDCGVRYPRWLVSEDDESNRKKYYTSEEMMKMVKKELPRIDFIGMFNDSKFSYFGCDHTSKNGDYSLEHKMALSIMILTYD